MTKSSLRLFSPNELDSRQSRELDRITGVASPTKVSIPLNKLVPLLIEASEKKLAWLEDFGDDNVLIDSDLFEVLMAYHSLDHSAAA